MNHSLIKLTAMLALSATPWLTQAQALPATGEPEDGASSQTALAPSRRIEGLWNEQVEQVDCRSGAPLHPIGRGTNLFGRGGSLIATNNAPPTVMGIALGQWRYDGGHGSKFRARMRLNLFQPPLETFLGVRDIWRDITLSADGHQLSGKVYTQDYFPDGSRNGNPICALETGRRVGAP